MTFKKTLAILMSVLLVLSYFPLSAISVLADGETYVAQIDSVGYETLKAAVAAANPGDVIELIASDTSLTDGSELVINKSITITGGTDINTGEPLYTIYGKNDATGTNDIFITGSGDVTISNVKIAQFGNLAATDPAHAPVYVSTNFTGEVTLDNVYISEFNRGGIFLYGGTFEVKDCYIDCANSTSGAFTKGIEIKNSASGTISNTFICNMERSSATYSSAGIEVYGYGDITVEGCTIVSDNGNHESVKATYGIVVGSVGAYDPAGGSLVVTDTMTDTTNAALSVDAGNYDVGVEECSFNNYIATWNDGSTVIIDGGDYAEDVYADAGTIYIRGGDFSNFAPYTGTGSIVITGGTFDADPSAYLDPAYESYDSGSGEFSVAVIPPDVAMIGTTGYKTLADAIAAVPTDGTETTITMIADEAVVSGVTIAAGKNIVLELNGHTISGNTDSTSTYALITNNGTLTIQDNTDTNKDGTGDGLITTYISNPDTGDVPGYASNTITNHGTLTVKSGKIVNNGSGYACYAIDNQTNGTLYTPVLNIEGGRMVQMNAYTYAVRMFCNSTTNTNTVNVSGGVIEGGYGLWLQTPNNKANKAELNITGGILNANDGAALYIGGTKADDSGISIDISGGEINGTGVIIQGPLSGTYGHVSISGGTIEKVQCGANVENFITGGAFTNEPAPELIAEDKVAAYVDSTSRYIIGDAAAQIGTIGYATLEDAFAAVASGETITLLKDITLTDRLFVNAGATPAYAGSNNRYATTSEDKSITLDLNGHNITSNSNIALAGGSLNITGTGTISSANDGLAPVEIRGTGTLTDKRTLTIGSNVTLNGAGSYGLNVFGSNDAQKNIIDVIVNGTVNGTLFVLGNLKNADNEINIVVNGTIAAPAASAGSSPNVGIALNGNANVTVNDGAAVSGDSGIEVRAGNLTVNGGTITATAAEYSYTANASGSTTKGAAIAVAQHTTTLATSATLNGGTLTGTKLIGITDVNNNMDNVTVVATESFTEKSAIPAGYHWVETSAGSGEYELEELPDVAVIGTTGYKSLADAVAAVPADDTQTTITMIADENIDVTGYAITVAAGQNIVLDLNGKTVTGMCSASGTSALIRNLGTLTICDSSTSKEGKLIGGADPTWTWDGTDNYAGSYASNLIRNEGTLVVNSGGLYNVSSGSAAYAIDNYDAGTVEINGGIIDAKSASTVRLFYNNGGGIEVTGGTIGHYTDDNDCSYMGIQVMSGTNADVDISGGTIAGMYALYSNATGGSEVSISGGEFDGYTGFGAAGPDNISITGGVFDEWVGTWGNQTGFISGGTFAEEPDPELVVQGRAACDDGKGSYIIGSATAEIGAVGYASLEAAFAAVKTGETIKLLADVALTDRLFVNAGDSPAYAGTNNRYATTTENKNITLDLNGHNITSSSNIALAGGSLNITGTGTISSANDGLAPVEIRGTGDLTTKRTLTIGENVVLDSTSRAYGLNVFGSNDAQKNIIDVTVNGTVNGTLFVLGNLKNADNEINIVVNGTIAAPASAAGASPNVGIALNGNANVTVNDGAAVSGDSGIEVRAGNLTVNDGTITATAAEYSYTANNSGSTTKGAAIAVAQHSTVLPTTVTLNGGTLSATKPVAVVDVNNNELADVTVTATAAYATGTTEIPEGFGWFETATAGVYELGKAAATVNDAPYATFAAAWAAADATDGSTLKLLEDASLTAQYEATGNFRLDLNGHDIETTHRLRLVKGTLNIINSGDATNTITTTNSGMAPVEVRFAATNDATAKRTLTIGEKVELVGQCYGLNIFGTNEATVTNDIEVNVNGKVTGMLFILGNLKNTANTININVNGTVDASGATGEEAIHTGIAQNGYSTVTIGTNAVVTGESGIETRAGRLIVNGGTITGTESTYSYTANGSGTTVKGAAIAVAQHNTGLPTTVTLNGGTLSATKPVAVVDVNNNELTDVEVTATAAYALGTTEIPEGFGWFETATTGVYELCETVTVTFNSMGGSDVASQEIKKGDTAKEPSKPTNGSEIFAGWFTSTDGGTTLSATVFDFADSITENITLYAKWTHSGSYVTQTTLALEGYIYVNFYLHIDSKHLAEGAYVEMTQEKHSGTTKSIVISDAELASYISDAANGIYKLEFPVAAQDMDVPVQLHLCDVDGGPIDLNNTGSYKLDDGGVQYRVTDYLENKAGASALGQLAEAMFAYNEAAEYFFDHRDRSGTYDYSGNHTPAAIPSGITWPESGVVTSGSFEGLSIASTTLLLDSETVLRFYFTLEPSATITNYTFSCGGRELTPQRKSGDTYYVDVTGIKAKELNNSYTVTVSCLSSGTYAVTYSPFNYINAKQNVTNNGTDVLMRALYWYQVKAQAYFGQ